MKYFVFIYSLLLVFHAKAEIDHYESVVLPGDQWTYLVPTSQPESSWTDLAFDDQSWVIGASGIGYGDGDDQTEISPTISLYMRTVFTISDLSTIEHVLLDMDYDDSFIAYLNGQEIARSLVSGNPPAFDQTSDQDHEANLYRGLLPERFEINQSLLQAGNNLLAVEIHNRASNSSDMTSIPTLSVGVNTNESLYRAVPDWFIPPAEPINFESSNLPIVIIETDNGQEIPNEPKISGSMQVIFDPENERQYLSDASNSEKLNFDGPIAIEVRGASTSTLEKKQYSLTTYDDEGKVNVSLLGMPEENDWILNGLGFDSSYVRDFFSYDLSRSIGQYAARGRYCEVVLNGDYIGLYVLQEKLKIDDGRINLKKLDVDDNSSDAVTGGYVIKADKTEGQDYAAWTMPNHNGWETAFVLEDPKPDEISDQQRAYIENHFRKVGYETDANDRDPGVGYPSLIDVPTFIDFMLLNELAANVDAYQFSTYFHKDRQGKLRAGPIWDLNLTYGNDLFEWGFNRSVTNIWQFEYENIGPKFWQDLYNDGVFRCYMRKRWNQLRASGQPFSIEKLHARLDSIAAIISEGAERDQNRWPRFTTYDNQISDMKTWLSRRVSWIDDRLPNAQTCEGEEIPNVQITQINYHSPEINGYDDDELEFITVTNLENNEIDLTGFYLGGLGIGYVFPIQTEIEAKGSLTIANDQNAFHQVFGLNAFDEFSRKISNSGQSIKLLNPWGNLVDEVTFTDESPWPEGADGAGSFLELIDDEYENDLPENWKATSLFDMLAPLAVDNHQFLQVYPVPTNDVLHIASKKEIQRVVIIDQQGKTMSIPQRMVSNHHLELQSSQLNTGLYLVIIQLKDEMVIRRVVVN